MPRQTRSATGKLTKQIIPDGWTGDGSDSENSTRAGSLQTTGSNTPPASKRRKLSHNPKADEGGLAEIALEKRPQRATLSLATAWPGIYQDKFLKSHHLAILIEHGVIFCVACKGQVHGAPLAVALPNMPTHLLKSHSDRKLTPKQREKIVETLRTYPVHSGNVPGPGPKQTVAPFPFLKTITADTGVRPPVQPQRCPACWKEGKTYIWVKQTTRDDHYKNIHKSRMNASETPKNYFAVQTFNEYNSWKFYFRVEQALVTAHPSEDIDQDAQDQEALRIYMDRTGFNILPQLSEMSHLCGLKDVNSFLWVQGWPREFADRDPKDLVSLVVLPDSHPWRLVFNACHYLFKGYQKAIPRMSARILKKWVDSEDSNKTSWAKTLATLTSTTIRAYSRTFSQLIHLVLITAERNPEGKTPNTNKKEYTAFLTDSQLELARTVQSLIHAKSRTPSVKELASAVHDLAVACLAPPNCDHIAQSKYKDITYVFMALKSIQSDASFRATTSLAKPNSGLQYLFRACLLDEARRAAEVDGFEVYSEYHKFLVNGNVPTPFSNMKTLRRAIIRENESTEGKRRLHWLGERYTICVYLGKSFTIAALQAMAQDVVQTTKHLLFNIVLFGIPLDELGWKELDYSSLQDLIGDRRLNYSVWRDTSNLPLQSLHSALLRPFMSHPKLRGYFYVGRLPDGLPAWDDSKQKDWLKKLGEFSLHLALSCLMYGGQSRRQPELLNMRNHNVAGRERNLFLFCDILIFILGYSKTTALTGVERSDVHALPPDITFLLFVYNALVRPLAVQWLRDLYEPNTSPESNDDIDGLFEQADFAKTVNEGPEGSESEQDHPDQEEDDDVYAELESDDKSDEATDDDKVETGDIPRSTVQDTFTFADQGKKFKPEAISTLLRKFGRKHLKLNLGFSGWRHISIAIARDILTPWLDEQAPDDTIFNALNGHSGRVSRKNYALEDGDRNLSSSKSFKKYIEACQLMHDCLNGKELPVKPSYEEQIQQAIKRLNDGTERIEAELTHVKEEQRKIGEKMDLIIELFNSR